MRDSRLSASQSSKENSAYMTSSFYFSFVLRQFWLSFFGLLLFLPAFVHAETINLGASVTTLQSCAYDDADRHQCAQAFTPSVNASDITWSGKVTAYNSPSIHLVLAVQGDSGGHPDGTDLGTLDVDPAGLSTGTCSVGAATHNFTITASLTGGTTYYLVFRKAAAVNASDWYTPCVDGGGTPIMQTEASGTWASSSNGELYGTITTTEGGGGGGGGATSTTDKIKYATSTAEQITQVYFNGFVLYFIGMFGFIWLLRKR